MLIDIHTHASLIRPLIDRGDGRRPTGEELVEMLDANGIDMAVVLPCVSPEAQSILSYPEETFELCARYPKRLIPFTNLDGRMVGNSPESDFGPLLQVYKDAGARGVGEYYTNLPFDDPLNMNVFKHVEASGLPLTFHIAPRIGGCYGCYDEIGLPRLETVLKTFPDLKLLGHSQPFWSEIAADVTEETRNAYPEGPVTPGRVVELMRRYPNLHGDLSAGSGFNAIHRDPEFGCAFLEEFQDRLFFGTDICHVPQEAPIGPWFRKLAEEKLVSEEALEKICWRNAAELLGLDMADDD